MANGFLEQEFGLSRQQGKRLAGEMNCVSPD